MLGVGSSIWNRALAGKGAGDGGNPPAEATPIHSLDLTTAPSASNAFDDYGLATSRTVTDYNGRIVEIPADAVPMGGFRPVRNLWPTADGSDTPSTQVITVTSGRVYQLRIGAESASGATAVCSGAFTGTLTGDGSDIQAFDTGKTATTTSLTVTITGSVRKIQLQDITHRADLSTAPDEYVPVGVATGPELVTNGTFDTAATGWSTYNSTLDVVGGELQVTTTGSWGRAGQAVTTEVGKTYQATCVARCGTAALAVLDAVPTSITGSTYGSSDSTNSTSNQTLSISFTATSTTTYLIVLASTAGVTAYFDDVTMKECDPGNTGVDGFAYFDTELANTVASNVVTEGTGASIDGWGDWQPGATNLQRYSNDFTQRTKHSSGTGAASPIVTAAYADGPLGPGSATRVQFNRGTATNGYSLLLDLQTQGAAETAYINSVWARAVSGTANISVHVSGSRADPANGGLNGYSIVELTENWRRVNSENAITGTGGSTLSSGIGLIGSDFAAGCDQTADILVCAQQLETGTVPTAYIPTTTGSAYRPAMSPAPTISGLVGTEDARLTVKGLAADLVTPDPTDTTERTLDVDNTDGEFDTLPSPIKVLSVDVYNDGERPA